MPESFKSGILNPVHKKDKDPTSVDNYSGITVMAIISKVFEYALPDKLTEMGLNRNQPELQVGFSEGLSLGLGSLFLSGASYESDVRRAQLYIALIVKRHLTSKIINLLYVSSIPRAWMVVCGQSLAIFMARRN